ncbi:hypothetical protein J1605_009548 [Eschrichtius robustus]|uniref:Uncharacterized protein n=1 Tax=Eschrichtius robustus TaxID=9764 RepID=A0AB34GWT2_ESCRO|nr:hypothetical protein J1605_009548 [Eschrichtius robustus]
MPPSFDRILEVQVIVHACWTKVYEHLHFVMEISQDEIFILDPDMVLSQQAGTPPGMPDLVVEQASGMTDWWNPALRKRMLSDSGLGMITPFYEDSDLKDFSHSRVLQ